MAQSMTGSTALTRLKLKGFTDAATNLKFPANLGTKHAQYYVLFKIYKTSQQTMPKINFVAGTGNDKGTVLERPFIKKPEFVALYMPATLTNVQNSTYQSAELGIVGAAAKAVTGPSGGDMNASKLAATGSELLTTGLKSASPTGKSLADIKQISEGVVVNNRTELIFDNIDRRSFTFDFKMIPRSEEEAQTIKNIVKTFRTNMAPAFSSATDTGKTMIVPSGFEIEFKPNKNTYLPKIGMSVCTSCTVTYGGARPQFFHDGSPVETSMTLQFQELEMITRGRILAGF